jgi:LPXTG-motif cell wall-anchored protein
MMKKSILIISLLLVFAISGLIPVIAQEQPKPGKDTVNIDTDAKPKFYYSTEDEKNETDGSGKSSAGTIAIIAGAVIVVAAGIFFLLKKKK